MEIPKNCRECEHDKSCTGAHYGSLSCKYHDEIIEQIICSGKEQKNGTD